MRPVIVIGGYGTFGSHVCRALARWGVPLTVAGRDGTRAQAFAAALGPAVRGIAADSAQRESCRTALAGQGVVLRCDGPFQNSTSELLDACLDAGCHYADICDDRGYAGIVRQYDSRFRDRGLMAVYGCSSLPGISGALASHAAAQATAPVTKCRVTLFIGNRNPKGQAAIRSLLGGLGRPICTAQKTLRGFRDRAVVTLPAPFGQRAVFNFESPEYDLFPKLLGTTDVQVKVGFELRPANYCLALLACLHGGYGSRTARFLAVAGRLCGGLGCSGGAVMTELFLSDGTVRTSTLLARMDGQRMAALPCALAGRALAEGGSAACDQPKLLATGGTHSADKPCPSGVMPLYQFPGAGPLLDELVSEGFELVSTAGAKTAAG